jgi:hypothetical protein
VSHSAGVVLSERVRDAAHSRVDLSCVVPSAKYSTRRWSRCMIVGPIKIGVSDFAHLSWNLKCCCMCVSIIVWSAYRGRNIAVFLPVRRFESSWQTVVTWFSPHCIARCGIIWSIGDLIALVTSKDGVVGGRCSRRYCVYLCRCVVLAAFNMMYPAVTIFPLSHLEFEIRIYTWALSMISRFSRFFHAIGFVVNPTLSPNISCCLLGRLVMDGDTYSRKTSGVMLR